MNESGEQDYARRLGQRLRAVRSQKRWSLHEVQEAADGEFSAAAVGSYERGERLISVPRLNRLALLYRVPVEDLLPPDEAVRPGGGGARVRGERGSEQAEERLVIDLGVLERRAEPEWEPVRRFARTIQVRRGDFNGRVLSVRGEDARSLALVCGHDVDEMAELIGA